LIPFNGFVLDDFTTATNVQVQNEVMFANSYQVQKEGHLVSV